MAPEVAKQNAEMQQMLVKKHLRDAKELWRRIEYPIHGDTVGILQNYAPEAIRYARQGKRFVELALESGTIKAKSRVRDELKAKCYADGSDHRLVNTGEEFDRTLENYRKQVTAWATAYFRNR